MMYRKASPRPTRFVLKIVTAGAGAMLGIACSSSGVEGSIAGLVDSGAPDASDAHAPCNPCGVVANPEGGDEHLMGLVDAGIIANPEAGDEEPLVGVLPNPEAGDEHPIVGVVANPEAGHD
jgi:hypothetical protein